MWSLWFSFPDWTLSAGGLSLGLICFRALTLPAAPEGSWGRTSSSESWRNMRPRESEKSHPLAVPYTSNKNIHSFALCLFIESIQPLKYFYYYYINLLWWITFILKVNNGLFYLCWDVILASWVENNKLNLSWKIVTSIFPQWWKHLEFPIFVINLNIPFVGFFFNKLTTFMILKEPNEKIKRQILWSNEF